MKILLVQPPNYSNNIVTGVAALNEPLALETVAGCIKDYEVEILDMRLNPALEEKLKSFEPDIVGVTACTAEIYVAYDILRRTKNYNKEILTVAGGHHATMIPEDFNKPFVDIIVLGEGEITFKELTENYSMGKKLINVNGLAICENNKLKFTLPRSLNENLDEFPFPNRELTKKYRQNYFRGNWKPMASIFSSRGCPFRCDFCAMWKINQGKYRQRSAGSLVNELAGIKEEYIDFADDNTLHDAKRAREIYDLIKKNNIRKTYKTYARADTVTKYPDVIEKWKEIGMELILIGFEAFRDKDLNDRKKGTTVKTNEEAIHILQQNDVEIAAYFLIDSQFDKEDFEDLLEYVKKMKLTHPVFTILTPFPGTDLYQRRYSEFMTYNYEDFDFFHAIFPTKLPLAEFYECFVDLYRRAYLDGKSKVMNSDIIERMCENKYVNK